MERFNVYGIDNSLHTRKVTFRLREETYAEIAAIVENEPNLWHSNTTVSGYLQRLIAADLKRRKEEAAGRSSDKPPAKRPIGRKGCKRAIV